MEQLYAIFGDRLIESILFGSRARGDFTPDSDVDILAFVNGLTDEDKSKIIHLESDFLLANGLLLSIHAIDQRQRAKYDAEPFIINARREGIKIG